MSPYIQQPYRIIGLMSGSSLDGLDLACCLFRSQSSGGVSWTIEAAATQPYSAQWQRRLKELPNQPALAFARSHVYFAHYLAEHCQEFITNHQLKAIDAIASHGHTLFHEGDRGFTCQIGDGASLAALMHLPVIANFRNQDVAKGGQGAPFAPIVERDLFPQYDFFLNLGGIANLSIRHQGKMYAFDVCPANQWLNALAQQLGRAYDSEGQLAARGVVQQNLLNVLNTWDFYEKPPPKSLGNQSVREWFPQLLGYPAKEEDKLATVTRHISIQIVKALARSYRPAAGSRLEVLCTGGGAWNRFLMQEIEGAAAAHNFQLSCTVPDAQWVDFKEALLMAWMGALRLEKQHNCLPTVTGASEGSCAGGVFLP